MQWWIEGVSKLCFFVAAWLVAPDIFKVRRLRTPLSLVSALYAVALLAGLVDFWTPDDGKLFRSDSFEDIAHQRDRAKKYDDRESKRRELPQPADLLHAGDALAQQARLRGAASALLLLTGWLLGCAIQWKLASWLDHDHTPGIGENPNSKGEPKQGKLVFIGAWVFAMGGILDCLVWFSRYE